MCPPLSVNISVVDHIGVSQRRSPPPGRCCPAVDGTFLKRSFTVHSCFRRHVQLLVLRSNHLICSMRGGLVQLFSFSFLSSGFEFEPQQYFLFVCFSGVGVLTISAEQFFLSPLCISISPLYLYIYTASRMNCDMENIAFFWRGGGGCRGSRILPVFSHPQRCVCPPPPPVGHKLH